MAILNTNICYNSRLKKLINHINWNDYFLALYNYPNGKVIYI